MCTGERDPVILKTFHVDLSAICQGRWDDLPLQNWTPGGVEQERREVRDHVTWRPCVGSYTSEAKRKQ